MKKFMVLAVVAAMLVVAPAFAVQRNVAANGLGISANATFAAGAPTTTDNADSCDIGVTPAATLLLPYFEVDTSATLGGGANTLFTITNTSPFPQVAHVTVWTDWSFPVLDFNIFLTGYDVQGISMFDVIARGIVVPVTSGVPGTSITTVPGAAPAGTTLGSTPLSNTSNPNFVTTGTSSVSSTCAGLPGNLPLDVVAATKNALTVGTGYSAGGITCSGSTAQVGANHGVIAKGYVTVDVAAFCSTQLPTDPTYYAGGTASILFDNVLIGDYQQIAPSPGGSAGSGFDAEGNAMVHIRAIPEGGAAGISGGLVAPTNLPFTFYDRYTPVGARTADRRQPLPSTWAARYIQGGANGFSTDYKIWREGITGNAGCAVQSNSALNVTSMVRFDEHENSTGFGGGTVCSPCAPGGIPPLPETSRVNTTSANFPAFTFTSGDVGGWMYMNLSTNSAFVAASGTVTQVAALSAQRAGFGSVGAAAPPASGSRTTSQNWVIVSMFGNAGVGRLAVDFDAAWLGNGCTPAPAAGAVIAPAQSQRATPPGSLVCDITVPVCSAGTVPPGKNP